MGAGTEARSPAAASVAGDALRRSCGDCRLEVDSVLVSGSPAGSVSLARGGRPVARLPRSGWRSRRRVVCPDGAAGRDGEAPRGSRRVRAGPAALRRVSGRTPVAPLPASDPKRPADVNGRTSDPPEASSPEVCSFRLPLTSVGAKFAGFLARSARQRTSKEVAR